MLERDITISPETLSIDNATRLVVRVDDSEELLPIYVSAELDDAFSNFIKSETDRINELRYTDEFTIEEEDKLLVLTGQVVSPILIHTSDNLIQSYEIVAFTEEDRTDIEWLRFLEEYPELALMCESDKVKYDTVKDFFNLRYAHSTAVRSGKVSDYRKRLSEFNDIVEERIENDELPEDAYDQLSGYFSDISQLLSVTDV